MTLSKLAGGLGSVGALAVVVAGFVVLAVRGEDTGAFLTLVGPVVSGLFVVGRLDARSDAQDQALTVITRQTNGVLTARIQEAVADALAARDQAAAPALSGDNLGLSAGGDNLGLSPNGPGVPAGTGGA